jgi:hypothetical protein
LEEASVALETGFVLLATTSKTGFVLFSMTSSPIIDLREYLLFDRLRKLNDSSFSASNVDKEIEGLLA